MDDAPWTDQGAGTVDVALVDAWVRLSVDELTAVRPRLDALNVFPVADADTGTNMLLTMRAGSDASHGADLSTVLTTLARGALLGARGNSGVILAAYLGGIALHLGSAEGASATDLADALAAGAVAARDAVADPVPGTALTAADAAASAARACAGEVDRAQTVRGVATVAADAADRAVEESSSLLAVLRDADVPDAGAAGIAAVLGALARAAGASRPRAETELPHHEVDRPSGGPEFEVMLVVRAAPEAPPEVDVAAGLRQALTECGDSVAVVAGPGHWQGHVHTDRPLRALAAAQEVADSAGAEMRQMCVHSLDLPGHHAGALSEPAVPGSLGVVVVTASPAWSRTTPGRAPSCSSVPETWSRASSTGLWQRPAARRRSCSPPSPPGRTSTSAERRSCPRPRTCTPSRPSRRSRSRMALSSTRWCTPLPRCGRPGSSPGTTSP